ncbi:hypothetical protein M2324_002057 [Rhodovulum sulfidophilum]|uniref:hypothetical protein n=1 Tax=Rhodovulum sulfidophilum TaxID=35806 RepID=UPI0005A8C687|nr:hypothetical protein [Rhodovulum sulfidophilum]ANB34480.1 hypothetical protein A6W98_10605 [Rhodovulum sulfidophilum DSM 1374]ANB38302.1 hypothetical protein A6024_10470 [Rhodovulum sulfidophilum]MCW2303655.1 hypothetical protein [Rhodovulum sulfidophilum]
MPIVFVLTSITGGVFSATVVSLILETGWGAILLSYWVGGMMWGGAAVSYMSLRSDDSSEAEGHEYETSEYGTSEYEDAGPGALGARSRTARSRAPEDVEEADRCGHFF